MDNRQDALLVMESIKISRKVAGEKIQSWEETILSEFPSFQNDLTVKDSYGHAITRELVEAYLVSQRHRLGEVLYQSLRFVEGPNICEIGAAFGSCLLPLGIDFGYKVHAFELRENIPAYSKALQKYAIPVSSFDFHKGIDDRSTQKDFDFVICSEVVEHLFVDISSVVDQLSTIVRPGGRVLITTPNTYRMSNILRIIRGYNANELHPKDAKVLDGLVVDARTHPREYTMFEVIEGFQAHENWKIVSAWTWPNEEIKTGTLREFLKIFLFRNFIRLPEGGLIWCVAELTK